MEPTGKEIRGKVLLNLSGSIEQCYIHGFVFHLRIMYLCSVNTEIHDLLLTVLFLIF